MLKNPKRSGHHRRRGRSGFVNRTAKSEDRIKNKPKKKQAHGKGHIFAEISRDRHAEQKKDDDIDQGNKAQEQPPPRFAGDLGQNIEIIDGDDGCPSRLASFLKNLPKAGHDGNNYDEVDAYNK